MWVCAVSVIKSAAAAATDYDDYAADTADYHVAPANDQEQLEEREETQVMARQDDDGVDDAVEWQYSYHNERQGGGRAKKKKHAGAAGQSSSQKAQHHRVLECRINDEYSVSCRQDTSSGDVYLPFSFISKYFEVHTCRPVSFFGFLFSSLVYLVFVSGVSRLPGALVQSFDGGPA